LQKNTICRLLSIPLVASILFGGVMFSSVPAEANYPDIALSINGQITQFNPTPQVIDTYVTVPMPGVVESLGGTVYWNAASQTMTAVLGSQTATVEVGNDWASLNASARELSVPPYISGGQLFVPLTMFGQAFGATVSWDAVDHIASVNTAAQTYQAGTGAQAVTVPDYSNLQSELQSYLSTRPGQWSVYVQDLSSGQSMGINAATAYDAASTIKLPLILYLYEQAAQGKVDLNTQLTYTSQYYEQGSGILQGQPFGGQYTLRQLASLAIKYSDNVAKNMIQAYVGYNNLIAFMQSLGGQVTYKVNGDTMTSPQDMARYLGALLVFRDENPALGNEILNYMEHSVYDPSGLPQELPAGVVVAHKMGALNDKWHDVGIVFAGDRPYIITVFSQNGWEDASLQTIADVSRIVYNYQTSLP